MNKRNKIILISLLSTIFVMVLVIGITKSFMKPIEQGGNITEVSLNSCAKIKLTSTSNVNLSSSYPMSRNRGLQTTPYKFTVTSYCDSYVGFNLYIATLSTNTIDAKYVRYVLTETGTKNVIQEGILSSAESAETDFTDTEKTELNTGIKGTYNNIYKIYNDKITYKGSNTYDLYLFLDGDVADNTTMGKTFKAGIAVKSYDREDDPILLTDYVKSQYTGTQGENGLYYHDSNLSNGAGDNSYRFAGSNPNNYICFGSEETTCPTENLYRIIGVIDNKIKLILADGSTTDMMGKDTGFINTYKGAGFPTEYYKGIYDLYEINIYKWSSSKTNTWSDSTTNKTNLNKNFLAYLNTKNEKWETIITNELWYVGGLTSTNGYRLNAKTAYDYEVGENKDASATITSKIGLMYVSEYYYGANPEYWTKTGKDDYGKAINDNWMSVGLYEWTISRNSDVKDYAFYVMYAGYINSYAIKNANVMRPTFFLTSSVQYASGDGTISNPIRLKI